MKIRKGSSTEFVLAALEETVDGLVNFMDLRRRLNRYGKGYGWGTPLGKSQLAHAIKRMKERGLVEYEEEKTDQILIKLTALGRGYLDDITNPGGEWDGVWRIVLFDVPESKRAVRDLFRRRLKDWEFKQWQRSVWVSKKDVTQKLRRLAVKLEIDEWVAVVESTDPALLTLLTRSLK